MQLITVDYVYSRVYINNTCQVVNSCLTPRSNHVIVGINIILVISTCVEPSINE